MNSEGMIGIYYINLQALRNQLQSTDRPTIRTTLLTFFLALPPDPSFFLAGALLGVLESFPPFFGG